MPDILGVGAIDEIVTVTDRDARAGVRHLAQQEAILAGAASGAVIHAAIAVAARADAAGKMIVAVLPDSGDRYFDHAAYQRED